MVYLALKSKDCFQHLDVAVDVVNMWFVAAGKINNKPNGVLNFNHANVFMFQTVI